MEFLLLCVVSLFAIINPFSALPAFISITPGDSEQERLKMARTACVVSAVVMLVLAVIGQWLFSLLGITLPALQIAGGVVLSMIGFDMLRAPDLRARLNSEESALARDKEDVAITPLAIPLLCGPGAISTVIILQTQSEGWWQNLALLFSVPVVYLASFFVLSLGVTGAQWLTPIVLRILKRLMGLLFVVIAVQFVINGIAALPFVTIK